ncbi:MAG TPA: branched-chain amino acid ABC transporter permease [Candidatus Caldiarchaeum subterraneum]|uniref:Branched-chain amino acid ABC transporter permease n=1 Tax=Caldiarchaeum subterraneum TaxID=311458 RepID=A0A833EAG8_CALS0|nr:branched-chain amino acid ABC transporter permease [Candidatus Caldarchaeum subterraneum]
MDKNQFRNDTIQILIAVVILALLPLLFRGAYQLRVLNLFLLFMLITIGFNLIFGHTNQLFLCQGALAGSSMYVSGLLALNYGIEPWLVIPLGTLLAGGLAAFFSFIAVARKLEAIFLGITTLSFQLIFQNLIVGLRDITGADIGFIPPELSLGPLTSLLGRSQAYYYLLIIILVVTLLIYRSVMNSNIGLALKMILDDEMASEIVGVNVRRVKITMAFAGAMLIGFTGALYGFFNAYVAPSLYEFTSLDIIVLIMLIFGGKATILGPIVGAGVFTILNEILRPLGPLTVLAYGVVLMILFIFFREGIIPWIKNKTKLPLI